MNEHLFLAHKHLQTNSCVFTSTRPRLLLSRNQQASSWVHFQLQFTSIQDGVNALGKGHTCPSHLSKVLLTAASRLVRWAFLGVLWRAVVQRVPFLCLSLLGDRLCGVLGFVPACYVSNSSTLQTFRDASLL